MNMLEQSVISRDLWSRYRIKFIENKKIVWEDIWALKGINFEIDKSDTVCILGENGSGKTTLLKLIAGLIKGEKGELSVNGSVSALLEIGTGFHPDLTGRENVYLNSSLFGLSTEEVDKRIDKIIEFSDLGRFINAPVKSYSQGMFVRLGFSVAVHLSPDILLIDDSLAVGDASFQKKCIRKIEELHELGKTLILVTHDMVLAKKLSRRALLLSNGILIKDSSINSTATFYIQKSKLSDDEKTLSDFLCAYKIEKRLDSSNFSLIVEDGRIRIKCRDIEITTLSGLISSVYSNSKWHDSNHAIWDINKISTDTILVKTEWEKLPIIQNWRIKLTENILKWDIDLEVKERFEAKEHKVGILLTDKYQDWLSSYEEGMFPKFSKVWQEIRLRDKSSDSIGTRSPSGTRLPSILFYIKDTNSNNSPLIQNSDEISSSRSLNAKLPSAIYEPGVYHYFSGSIELIEDDKIIKEYLSYYKNRLTARTISDGGYSLIIEEGKLKIMFNDIEITRFPGLNSRFSYLGVEYEASQADWGIKKLSDSKIGCQLGWDGLPFSQRWVFESTGKDKLFVEMFFKLEEEAKIENVSTEFYLASTYREWFTEQEKGNFLSLERVGNIAPVKLLYNKSRILGVNQASNLPSLALFSLYDGPILSTICKLFKDTENSIMLSILNIETEPEKKLGAGDFLFNKFEILLQGGAKEPSIFVSGPPLVKKNQAELKTSLLNFVFDDGRGRLFYKDIELTKAFCIFTSVCSSKIWYDSAQAAWKQISNSENYLELEGAWPRLPLIQNWKFSFEDTKSLLIEIRSRLYKEFDIEREQFSIMLTDKYNKWEVEKQAKGIFQPNFSKSYDIISYRMWSGKYGQGKIKISSQQPCLPAVYIDFPLVKNDFWAVIENSDDISQSRVIQAQRVYSGREARDSDKAFDYFKMRILVHC